MPSVTFPDTTRKNVISPKCGSTALLKTNSEVGAELSAAISRPSVVLKAGALIGPGATLMMNSISRLAPMSRLPEAQNTGIRSRLASPSFRPERSSSCVSTPLSK